MIFPQINCLKVIQLYFKIFEENLCDFNLKTRQDNNAERRIETKFIAGWGQKLMK